MATRTSKAASGVSGYSDEALQVASMSGAATGFWALLPVGQRGQLPSPLSLAQRSPNQHFAFVSLRRADLLVT